MTKKNNQSRTFTADQIANFVKGFLLNKYANPVPIPEFHKEMWAMVARGGRYIGVAAPRFHAKSTAITHALTLFLFLFRIKKYGIIVSDTEGQASQFLGDIKLELEENQGLRKLFGVKAIIKDSVTDIIVEMTDNWRFRIQAKGAEQKIRGSKWDNYRPDWIVIDDLENDESVESDIRREKLKNWFLRALMPTLGKNGTMFMVGTILHMDSMLMSIVNMGKKENAIWESKLYKAHEGFDDFSNILWPDQWPEDQLRYERQKYVDANNPEGYSQEWLNDPVAHSEAFFRRSDFQELEDEMRTLATNNYAAVDLAISDADKAAYTVIVIGGVDQHRRLQIKNVIRFRGDANEIINQMFQIQQLYDISIWKVEEGQISKTLMGPIIEQMNARGVYLNISTGVPTKDKRSRARAIQARMRAGGVYFPKQADWYASFEQELLHFPKGVYKDQVDAISWLGIAINELNEGPTEKDLEEDDFLNRLEEFGEAMVGRNATTGY